MFKTIDLFAGAGGLSYGFEATNQFRIVAAAENNSAARKTYVKNHKDGNNILMIPDVLGYDFKSLNVKFDGIDVVIGGPPCQGFSNANRQKNHIISMNNSLVKEYFRAVKEIRPKAFVMENVSMLSSDTHRFYDSLLDHDEVTGLGIEMRKDELVISDQNYNGINCLEVLSRENSQYYRIPDKLLQLLNVLYKDRKSKEDRLNKYIEKNEKTLLREINSYLEQDTYEYDILHRVHDHLCDDNLQEDFEELGKFIKFQKSFRLKDELDENRIIYDMSRVQESGKIIATVYSYPVIEYVNKILGNEYNKKSGIISALWFGVPQERKRFIMMGIRSDVMKDAEVKLPDGSGELPDEVTVGEAIMDLRSYPVYAEKGYNGTIPYIEQQNLSPFAVKMREGSRGVSNAVIPGTRDKAKKRFASLKEGENFHKLTNDLKDNYADPGRTQNSIYLRLDRNRPSGTVVNVRKSMWIHPTLDRAISVREAARLQSFPDRFIFEGTKDSMYQQIGNAVPPLMAKGIAETLLKYL